jgi:hypothetical protein
MAAWNETPEGANVAAAWAQFQYTYVTRLPNHIQSLTNLANRPITG